MNRYEETINAIRNERKTMFSSSAAETNVILEQIAISLAVIADTLNAGEAMLG